MPAQTDAPPTPAPTSQQAPRRVPLAAIKQDDRTWPRGELDNERVRLFAELYASDADRVPPVELFAVKYEGQPKPVYVLVDGWHRMAARKKMRASDIPAIIRDDLRTLDDAFMAACEKSADASKPLSSREKRAAVRRILKARPDLSDRAIARMVGCSPPTVGAQRNPLRRTLSSIGDALSSDGTPARRELRPIGERVYAMMEREGADEEMTHWARRDSDARAKVRDLAVRYAKIYQESAPATPANTPSAGARPS